MFGGRTQLNTKSSAHASYLPMLVAHLSCSRTCSRICSWDTVSRSNARRICSIDTPFADGEVYIYAGAVGGLGSSRPGNGNVDKGVDVASGNNITVERLERGIRKRVWFFYLK